MGLAKTLSPVRSIRAVRKHHMVHNGATPVMEIDHQTYAVRADGELSPMLAILSARHEAQYSRLFRS